MRHLAPLFIFLTFTPFSRVAAQGDAQLTKLMVGAWRSPRHDYLYLADGTWWMGRIEPHIAHGRWRIRDRHLEESITYGDDSGAEPTEDHGLIQRLTRREIRFGGVYRMVRIKVEEVDVQREPHPYQAR